MPSPDRTDGGSITPSIGRATRRRLELSRARAADLYDAWKFAAADATLALTAWRSAGWSEKRSAHVAYVAALDREAQAADVLGRRLRGAR